VQYAEGKGRTARRWCEQNENPDQGCAFQDDTPLFTASVSNASPLLRDFLTRGGVAYPACALQVKKGLNLAVTIKKSLPTETIGGEF
jgi:hypothetical protein